MSWKVFASCGLAVKSFHSALGSETSSERYTLYPTTSFSGFGGKNIEIKSGDAAIVIDAGGLGDPIVAGLALADTRMVLSGAVPAALLALGVDAGLGVCERAVRPDL